MRIILLVALSLAACGPQPVDECSTPAVDAPCCPSEVALERCDGRQRWVCETTSAGQPPTWFAVGCCPGDAGTSAICGG